MLKFDTAIREHQYYCQSVGMSPKTLKSYRNTPNLFFKWLETNYGITNTEDISKHHFQDYFKYKLDKGLTKTYVLSLHKTLKAMFDYLHEDELINKNPMDKLKYIKAESNVIECYTDKQAKEISNFYKHTTYLHSRNRVIIMLQLDTGIRCTETINLTVEDIQLDLDRVFIKNGKGDKSRFVFISHMLRREIRKHIRIRDEYFKGKSIPDNFFLSRTARPLTVEAIERNYKVIHVNVKIIMYVFDHIKMLFLLIRNVLFYVIL